MRPLTATDPHRQHGDPREGGNREGSPRVAESRRRQRAGRARTRSRRQTGRPPTTPRRGDEGPPLRGPASGPRRPRHRGSPGRRSSRPRRPERPEATTPSGGAGRRSRTGQSSTSRSSTRSPLRPIHTRPGGVREERRQHTGQRAPAGKRVGLEHEIESSAGRHRHPSQGLHASGPRAPPRPRDGPATRAPRRSAPPTATSHRARGLHPTPLRTVGPDSPAGPRRGRGRTDREDVGAAGDVPVVRRQHAPGHGVGAIREGTAARRGSATDRRDRRRPRPGRPAALGRPAPRACSGAPRPAR